MTRVARTLTPLLLALLLLVPAAALADVPPAPVRWVTDEAGFLSQGARTALDARLEAYQKQSGHHVLVWIARTTGLEPIEDFSVRAFKAWQVGRKGLDDGIVLFVMADDRKLRFEVGYGLESKVPDAIASRIIREAIVPRIPAGDRDGAIQSGIEALLAVIEGPAALPATAPAVEAAPPRRAASPLGDTAKMVILGLILVAFLILFVTNPVFALQLAFSILSSGRGGGGYSGGSGGGGGYSGGGGRSGGGGASGSW